MRLHLPLCARSLAVSFPMPVLAPVIITTFPSSLAVDVHRPPATYRLQGGGTSHLCLPRGLGTGLSAQNLAVRIDTRAHCCALGPRQSGVSSPEAADRDVVATGTHGTRPQSPALSRARPRPRAPPRPCVKWSHSSHWLLPRAPGPSGQWAAPPRPEENAGPAPCRSSASARCRDRARETRRAVPGLSEPGSPSLSPGRWRWGDPNNSRPGAGCRTGFPLFALPPHTRALRREGRRLRAPTGRSAGLDIREGQGLRWVRRT